MNSVLKFILPLDIVVSFLMAGGLIVCGVLLTVYGKESVWRDPINRVSADTTAILIRQAMTTAGVFCFMGTALFILVAVLMLVFLIKDWRRREIRTNSASRQGNTAERETTGNEQRTNQTQI
jgi:heme/copper-type cytochrome/quinol oxidase subunit 1